MDGSSETLADIVAEKREREAAQSSRETRDAMDYAATAARPAFIGVDLSKDKPTYTCVEIAPGNAAAMREALERIVGWCEGCHADACEKVCRPELTSESIHAALAALSAPARNADRFADIKSAYAAFCNEVPDWEDHDGIPDYWELAKWLFATAKGADHA